MKKFNVICMVSLLWLSVIFTVPAYAQSPIRLNVNGVFYDEYRPVVENGSTLVPLSFVAQKLNLKVSWSPNEKK